MVVSTSSGLTGARRINGTLPVEKNATEADPPDKGDADDDADDDDDNNDDTAAPVAVRPERPEGGCHAIFVETRTIRAAIVDDDNDDDESNQLMPLFPFKSQSCTVFLPRSFESLSSTWYEVQLPGDLVPGTDQLTHRPTGPTAANLLVSEAVSGAERSPDE